jgi:biotin transport system substrate-specific component
MAADRGRTRSYVSALAVMIVGHLLILVPGWAWLSRSLGGAEAYQEGVAPFLGGMLLKSAVAALFAVLAARGWLSRTEGSR